MVQLYPEIDGVTGIKEFVLSPFMLRVDNQTDNRDGDRL